MSDCRFGVSPVNYPDPLLFWPMHVWLAFCITIIIYWCVLLPDIVFLGHRGINELLLYKMLISFLSQRFRFCLSQGFLTPVFCQTGTVNWDIDHSLGPHFRIESDPVPNHVIWNETGSLGINDHKWMPSANFLYINLNLLCILYHNLCYFDNVHFDNESVLK